MATQLFRSASAIGAMLEEGQVAASARDMGAKYAIALREAREARYWLRLLMTQDVPCVDLEPMFSESGELVAMLTVAVRKLRQKTEDKRQKT